jgi:hypothetical protein
VVLQTIEVAKQLSVPVLNMHLNNGVYFTLLSHLSDESTIMEYVNRLFHMHIHDACYRDNHLPFGEGKLNLAKYLHLARTQDCRAVLEVKTVVGLRKSVKWLEKKGYICETNRTC